LATGQSDRVNTSTTPRVAAVNANGLTVVPFRSVAASERRSSGLDAAASAATVLATKSSVSASARPSFGMAARIIASGP
jgi:hypothetical protein